MSNRDSHTLIADNIRRIKDNINQAELRANREPDSVMLLGISKTFGAEVIDEAVQAGLSDIGENRVQEAQEKFPLTQSAYRKHLVGHLQTNKVKKALDLFDVIHSVDSLKLAKKISANGGRTKEIFLEVNTSGEETKFGIAPDGAIDLLSEIVESTDLTISGLMTIGPNTNNEGKIRSAFVDLRDIFIEASSNKNDQIKMQHLSMGMSGDYEIAIEEGATIIRVGRVIFGQRY